MEPEQPPISIPNYEPLFGSDATSLSPLSGSVVTARQNAAQVRGVTGRLRHGGGKLVVDDGLFKFADNDGFMTGSSNLPTTMVLTRTVKLKTKVSFYDWLIRAGVMITRRFIRCSIASMGKPIRQSAQSVWRRGSKTCP